MGLGSFKHLYCVLTDARATCFGVRRASSAYLGNDASHVTTPLPQKW